MKTSGLGLTIYLNITKQIKIKFAISVFPFQGLFQKDKFLMKTLAILSILVESCI